MARARKRFTSTTMNDHDQPVAANVLDRQFTAESPNQRLDVFSRFVVGWPLSAVNDRHMTIRALEMALKRRGPDSGLLHHSDQGCTTYASEDYQAILEARGIICSMRSRRPRRRFRRGTVRGDPLPATASR